MQGRLSERLRAMQRAWCIGATLCGCHWCTLGIVLALLERYPLLIRPIGLGTLVAGSLGNGALSALLLAAWRSR